MVKVRKLPQRTCVGCRSVKAKKELIRVVRTPEGQVIVDVTGKKSGRGAYICPSRDCLRSAVKGKRLESALECSISADTISQLEEELMED